MSLRFVAFVASLTAVLAQDPPKPPDFPPGLPATLAGMADEGRFLLFRNEEQLAVIDFRWLSDGTYSSDTVVTLAGQTLKAGLRVTPDAQGRWEKIAYTTPAGDFAYSRVGTQGQKVFKDQTTKFELREGATLFDNNSPALMAMLLRGYDRAKGGPQKIPVLVLPAGGITMTFEWKEKFERAIAGKEMIFDRFTLQMPGAESSVVSDLQGKVVLLEMPVQKVAFLREGFEALRTAPSIDPTVSQPTFEVTVMKDVRVPMRDGVKLATDVYLPKGVDKAPLILVRTPYKKDLNDLQARYFARRGYGYAVQDVRGRFASEGKWEPFIAEPKDGYDTIEWLAKQPYSNGKIGMIGASYLGWVQWWAASQKPPHLVTIIPNVAPPDPMLNIPYEYGVHFALGAIWWSEILESGATADLTGKTMTAIGERRYGELLKPLPVIDADKRVFGKENAYWRKWIEHPTKDSYWKPVSFLDQLKDVKIPVFHQSGWFDGDGIGSKLNYAKMASHGHPNQKLTLGPWGHTDTSTRMIGGTDFTAAAQIDLQRDYLRWFDHFLKGTANGIDKEPLVSLFVMGTNKWLRGDKYPLAGTVPTRLYLGADRKATLNAPAGEEKPDVYTYDPGDPTPWIGYRDQTDEDRKKTINAQTASEDAKKEADALRKQHESRPDVLVYTTEPFERPLTFAGPLAAVVYASSSAKDTDWFVKLTSIDEKDKPMDLVSGKLRARFRKSLARPEMLKPGEVYEYTIDLWQTGITVKKGHRLKVTVTSAAFPLFSRNLNTGGHNEKDTNFVKAEQKVFRSAKYPSHILLPVIPETELAKASDK